MLRLLLALSIAITTLHPGIAQAFDPLKDDISGFVLATALNPDPGRLQATLEMRARRPDGTELEERFILRAIEPPARAPRGARYFYTLDPTEAARLEATRARIAAWKDDAPETQGSLAFNLDLGSAKDVRGSLWISPKAGARYRLIVNDEALS